MCKVGAIVISVRVLTCLRHFDCVLSKLCLSYVSVTRKLFTRSSYPRRVVLGWTAVCCSVMAAGLGPLLDAREVNFI